MSKFEYEVSRFNLRSVPDAAHAISAFGARGFRAIFTVKDNQDLLILFEKEIAPKAKVKAKPKSE